jgi:anti-sigma B factor antagonist
MAELERHAVPVVVERLPDEIDLANAEWVRAQLAGACVVGAIVVADMTGTTFCDSLGTQALLTAAHQARELHCQLRIASSAKNVLRVWQILGADRVLEIYPTVAAAADAPARPEGEGSLSLA